MKLAYEEVKSIIQKILRQQNFEHEKARLIAQIFVDASVDGYHSHGLNRFAEFVKNVNKGVIDPHKEPILKKSFGVLEQWDGQLGPGPSNAHFAMKRAIELARKHTMGCVALANTNHWMRGGTYGWQATEADCIAICFTNTMPNMAPWGGISHTTGNNPLVLAVPHKENPIVLDMSLTQFSYGQLYKHRLEGKELAINGGYDQQGNLTSDPVKILETRRLLPTGFWKGSGLSLMLDLAASLLSAGSATCDIARLDDETALSQVFICIDKSALGTKAEHNQTIDSILSFFTSSAPVAEGDSIRYPGLATLKTRKRQLADGIEINDEVWAEVVALIKN